MYRFVRQPKWIALHLVILGAIVAMVNLGFWQLRRLDTKRERNHRIEAGIAARPVPLADLVPPDTPASVGTSLRYRRVTVSGTYRFADEVRIGNRTVNGSPGYWIVTPLDTGDGLVAVLRGWRSSVGFADTTAPFADTDAPAGRVSVVGVVQPTEKRGPLGGTDPSGSHLDELVRLDIGRLDAQVDGDLFPVYVQLDSQEPPDPSGKLVPYPLPELDEGPHLGYAFQWFVFSVIVAVGYPLALRRQARSNSQPESIPDDPSPPAG